MFLALLLAVHVAASAQPVVTVAIVNVSRLLTESVVGKASSARLDALRKQQQQAITAKQAAIQALNQKSAAPADIQRAQVELQRLGQDADAAFQALNQQLLDEFFKKLQPILKQILEEDHIGLIFEYPNKNVLWFDPSIDITAKALQRLDAATTDKK